MHEMNGLLKKVLKQQREISSNFKEKNVWVEVQIHIYVIQQETPCLWWMAVTSYPIDTKTYIYIHIYIYIYILLTHYRMYGCNVDWVARPNNCLIECRYQGIFVRRRANFKTLGPRKNGHNFPNDIVICIFLDGNLSILLSISLKLCFYGSDYHSWHRPGYKPLSTPMWMALDHYYNQWWVVYWRIYASLGLIELRCKTK